VLGIPAYAVFVAIVIMIPVRMVVFMGFATGDSRVTIVATANNSFFILFPL
jgi:hypothetical protein